MKEKITIVKIGGNVVDHDLDLKMFLQDFASINGKKILIHGGGKVATDYSKKLGVKTQMIEGRRVTDEESLGVVTMVYAGLINKKISSFLQSRDCNAVGLSGADGNLLKSIKRKPINNIDYGFVGDIEQVNSDFFELLLDNKYTPIICPITHDKNGNLLNSNADGVAANIAIELSKKYTTQLVYCFELPGVMQDINNEDSVIWDIDSNKYKLLKEKGLISDGMIPKMDSCYKAIDSGVDNVRICLANDIREIVEESKKAGTILYGDFGEKVKEGLNSISEDKLESYYNKNEHNNSNEHVPITALAVELTSLFSDLEKNISKIDIDKPMFNWNTEDINKTLSELDVELLKESVSNLRNQFIHIGNNLDSIDLDNVKDAIENLKKVNKGIKIKRKN